MLIIFQSSCNIKIIFRRAIFAPRQPLRLQNNPSQVNAQAWKIFSRYGIQGEFIYSYLATTLHEFSRAFASFFGVAEKRTEKDKSRRKYKKVLSNYDNLLIYYSRHFMFIIIYAPLAEYFYAEDVFFGQ